MLHCSFETTRLNRSLTAALALLLATPAALAQLSPGPNPITGNVTTAQTLASGTGTVNGNLSVTGNNVAVTVTGNSSLINNGTIQQTSVLTGGNAGNGRAIRVNTTGLTLSVTNNLNALIQTADADTIQMNKASGTVTLYNYGTISSLNSSAGGNQALDWNALTTGNNTLWNYATGIITASEADAIRPGVNGTFYNDGLIKAATTTGSSSDGIDAQSNSGVSIINAEGAGAGTGTGTIEGGRHGITGGAANLNILMSVTNNLGGTIKGDNGAGINIDGFSAAEVITIVNHGLIQGNGVSGDGDGVDVDGLVNLTNTGTIKSLNSVGTSGVEYSEGVTVGGGTINNSGTIQGSVAAGNTTAIGRGITIAGVDKDTAGNAIPVQAPYAATTIINSGLVRGDSDSGIVFSSALASGFSHVITNLAGGQIQTGSVTAPSILTAADRTTINNYGTIDGSSSGKAIVGGSGNLALNIYGGSAAVLGNIAGGTGANTLTMDPGAAQSFAYAGSISSFDTVNVASGSVTLTGVSTYTGTTQVSGGLLRLDGRNLLAAASQLELDGGTMAMAHAGGANGQTFASLLLNASSSLDLGLSSLTFNALGAVGSGAALSILNWSSATSPNYAIRFLGDNTGSALFLALISGTSVDGFTATYHFDGIYTDITAGTAAVPLPASLQLLLSGLLALALVGRRRSQNGRLAVASLPV